MASATSQPSLVTRAKVWFNSLTLFTKATFVVCVTLYVVELIVGDYGKGRFCLSASSTFSDLQVYRIFTSAFLHMGILHLTFNMLAFVPMGQQLERLVGTVQFGYLVTLITVLSACIYAFVAQLLYHTGIYPHAIAECAVGLSGTIFGLIVITVAHARTPTVSIFGLFEVPSNIYPWALLVFWQLLVPNVSFLGHLSGVCVGQLWVMGWLRPLELPTPWIHRIEGALSRCHGFGGFVHSNQLPTTAPYASATASTSRETTPLLQPVSDWIQRARGAAEESATFIGKGMKVGKKLTHSAAAPLSEPFAAASPLPTAAAAEADAASRRAAIAAAAEARLLGAGGKGTALTVSDTLPVSTHASGAPRHSQLSSDTSSSPPPPQRYQQALQHAGGAIHNTSDSALRGSTTGRGQSDNADHAEGGSDPSAQLREGLSAQPSLSSDRRAQSFQAGMLRLQEMGFSSDASYSALMNCGGDVDAALEELLHGP